MGPHPCGLGPTWLKHAGSPSNLVSAPLAAECEWHGEGNVRDDFDKLLLAQANLRLMIFYWGRPRIL